MLQQELDFIGVFHISHFEHYLQQALIYFEVRMRFASGNIDAMSNRQHSMHSSTQKACYRLNLPPPHTWNFQDDKSKVFLSKYNYKEIVCWWREEKLYKQFRMYTVLFGFCCFLKTLFEVKFYNLYTTVSGTELTMKMRTRSKEGSSIW